MICSLSTFTLLRAALVAARALRVYAPSLWPSPSYLAKIQFHLQTGNEAELKLGEVILIGHAAEGCARRNILDTDVSPHLQRQCAVSFFTRLSFSGIKMHQAHVNSSSLCCEHAAVEAGKGPGFHFCPRFVHFCREPTHRDSEKSSKESCIMNDSGHNLP